MTQRKGKTNRVICNPGGYCKMRSVKSIGGVKALRNFRSNKVKIAKNKCVPGKWCKKGKRKLYKNDLAIKETKRRIGTRGRPRK